MRRSGSVRLSPDGKTLWVAGTGADAEAQKLVRIEVETGKVDTKPLPSGPGQARFYVAGFAPDGVAILARQDDNQRRFEAFRVGC